MFVTGQEARAHEEMPQSQRVTIPSPQPSSANARFARSPGEYRLVDGQPMNEPQSRR